MNRLIRLTLCALAFASSQAFAQAANPVGEVTVLTGRATAVGADGSIRALAKGSKVNEGELIATGPSSYLNLEFRDQSRILLRPNTRFEIEEFRYATPTAASPGTLQGALGAAAATSTQPESAFFRLVKGGFRAVTGAVGKRENSRYRVRTPVATIGIRGTDYEARMCAGDCMDIDPPPTDGLYAGVNSGEIEVAKGSDVVARTPGQFLFVPQEGSIQPLSSPPAVLTQDPMPNPENCN